METKRKFGGAQENAGRPPKEGTKTTFKLTKPARAILQETARREGLTAMAPALELIARDYARRNNIPFNEDEGD